MMLLLYNTWFRAVESDLAPLSSILAWQPSIIEQNRLYDTIRYDIFTCAQKLLIWPA